MDLKLENKLALVTGSSAGIGLAIAQALAAEGCRVIVNGRTEDSVARAAEAIASHHPNLDAGSAYIVGTLHDIGRRFGVSGMRHILDGYTFLMDKGYDDAASICLTHSYPTHTPHAASEEWDGFESELNFVREFLAKVEFVEYDRLIQLCEETAQSAKAAQLKLELADFEKREGGPPPGPGAPP